jgi:hypothetical protein
MANEARLSVGLQISADNLRYQSQPTAFAADVTGRKGPTPGAITAPVGGKAVDLGELITPGLCRLMNVDSTNYVEVGIWDPGTDVFYPLVELLPGESFVIRLSRNIQEEYVGTGTGTTGPGNRLFVKANFADCVVLVEAFEK